jgi:hypothetical protein
MTRPDPGEKYARNAVDRAQLQARLGPQLSWHHQYDRRKLRRHGWRLDKTADGASTTVASGRNFTKGGADRAWYRAYLLELNRRDES